MSADLSAQRANRRCPLCRRPTEPEFRPFCSRGCRDRDLVAWGEESYALPGRPPTDEGDDATPASGSPANDRDDA